MTLYHLVTGSVLSAWKIINAILSHRRLKIVRTQMDDGSRVVGVFIPAPLVDELLDALQSKSEAQAEISPAAPERAKGVVAVDSPTPIAAATTAVLSPAPIETLLPPTTERPLVATAESPRPLISFFKVPAGKNKLSVTLSTITHDADETALAATGLWISVPQSHPTVRFAVINAEPDDAVLDSLLSSDEGAMSDDSDFIVDDDDFMPRLVYGAFIFWLVY